MTEKQKDYQSVDDVSGQQRPVLGSKFFPVLAGKTNGAHQNLVNELKSHGQVEVDKDADADYLMVFCPIASRVETDINEALSKVLPNKDIILVVMHHTFDPDRVVAESRRLVHNSNVILTVDYLFHNEKLLQSNRNDISWREITKALGIPYSEISWFKKYQWYIVAVIAVAAGLCATLLSIELVFKK
uniref:Uncharacterized protein n=1 Tax=Iconisemion striatum TaxID=60296 RepID=A0A1A7WUS4_9TELE